MVLNFSASWRNRPSRTNSRPMAAHSVRVVFAADVVGRERVMVPFADFFRFLRRTILPRCGSHPHRSRFFRGCDRRRKEISARRRCRPRFGGGERQLSQALQFIEFVAADVRRLLSISEFRASLTSAATLILLAEIIQQECAAAGGAFGVVNNLLQLRTGILALLRIGHLVDEAAVFDAIAGA